MMRERNLVVERFGVWLRLYVGSTSSQRRAWRWVFDGAQGRNHGVTFRLRGEECIGAQWRYSPRSGASAHQRT